MEEELKNIFVECVLPPHFEWPIWQAISLQSPSCFQQEQLRIYQILISSAKYEVILHRFKHNHLALYGWTLLVGREKADIQPYLFRPLLHQTPSFQNTKLSNAISSNPAQGQARRALARAYRANADDCSVNSRELYLETLSVCRGERCIPLNYWRHSLKGNQRSRYNAFIRQTHKAEKEKHNRNYSNPLSSRPALAQFTEWEQHRQRTALLPFRRVLEDKGLNSQQGLQAMLKRQGSHKLVFVNHQRKPVNYYLRSHLPQQ